MKKLMILFALIMGVVSVKAQSNDLYQGITKKLPYRQMVTPYGVQVTFAKTVHIIFPSAVKYVDLGSNYIIAGKRTGRKMLSGSRLRQRAFPVKPIFPLSVRMAVFIPLMQSTHMNRNAEYRNERFLGE